MSVGYHPEVAPSAEAAPQFPPLLTGVAVPTGDDPFEVAVADARAGRSEIGRLYWSPDDDTLRAAVVFEPEVPLAEAAPIVFAAAVALNDCIGALAPPEVGLQHIWPTRVKINGAFCGGFRVQASTTDAAAVPDWLIVGLTLPLTATVADPGNHPDVTTLAEEGCGHLGRVHLLESWSRHLLVWVNRWEDDGYRPIFDAWLGRTEGRGEDVTVDTAEGQVCGTFLGLDEHGGLLMKTGTGARTLPLLPALEAGR